MGVAEGERRTLRFGVGTWPCKERCGAVLGRAGLGPVSWGREARPLLPSWCSTDLKQKKAQAAASQGGTPSSPCLTPILVTRYSGTERKRRVH